MSVAKTTVATARNLNSVEVFTSLIVTSMVGLAAIKLTFKFNYVNIALIRRTPEEEASSF